MTTLRTLWLVLLLFVLAGSPTAHAQASLARKPVAEILEHFTKKSGGAGLRELEQIGGERAVREVVEKAVAEGGEAAGQQVIRAVRRHGVSALEAIKAEPGPMLRALSKMPDDLATRAVAEASRSPALVGRLVRTYGDEALTVSSKHPGVGAQVIEEFGTAGVHAGRTLNTGEMIVLKRAKGYESLGAREKDAFARLFDRKPREFYNALLVAGGGAAIVITADTVMKLQDTLLGTAEKPGALISAAETAVRAVSGILIAAVLAYAGIKLWGTWRSTRTRTRRT